MSILEKVEQNINHGDIQITINASQNISSNDLDMPVTVTIANKSQTTQTIKKVNIEIRATDIKGGYEMGMSNIIQIGNTVDQEMYSMETFNITKSQTDEAFTLQSSESQNIYINFKIRDDLLDSKIDESNCSKYKYVIYAYAEVEGLVVKPKAKQDLHIAS